MMKSQACNLSYNPSNYTIDYYRAFHFYLIIPQPANAKIRHEMITPWLINFSIFVNMGIYIVSNEILTGPLVRSMLNIFLKH